MRKNNSIKKRTAAPDHKYNNPALAKFINYVMLDGKKSVARAVVYRALSIVEEKTKQEAMTVFDTALKNVSPTLEVKSKRVGGANYQVPMQVRGDRRQFLAMNWIIRAARSQKGRAMSAKLADELIAAAKGEGAAVKRREDTERMAAANRAFAHFA
ncbi:MAG: 30S ribosomal protein S7 [Candidatus Spechtbacterales bacterium]